MAEPFSLPSLVFPSSSQIELRPKLSTDQSLLHHFESNQSPPANSQSPFVFLPSEFWKNFDSRHLAMETQPDLRLSIFMNELYSVLPDENQVTLPSISSLLQKVPEENSTTQPSDDDDDKDVAFQIPNLKFVPIPKPTQPFSNDVSKVSQSIFVPNSTNSQYGSKRKRWSEVDMALAMDLVRSRKMSCRAAAMAYNLPRSTLWDRVSQRGTKKLRQSSQPNN
jgi:hypothetical protein